MREHTHITLHTPSSSSLSLISFSICLHMTSTIRCTFSQNIYMYKGYFRLHFILSFSLFTFTSLYLPFFPFFLHSFSSFFLSSFPFFIFRFLSFYSLSFFPSFFLSFFLFNFFFLFANFFSLFSIWLLIFPSLSLSLSLSLHLSSSFLQFSFSMSSKLIYFHILNLFFFFFSSSFFPPSESLSFLSLFPTFPSVKLHFFSLFLITHMYIIMSLHTEHFFTITFNCIWYF